MYRHVAAQTTMWSVRMARAVLILGVVSDSGWRGDDARTCLRVDYYLISELYPHNESRTDPSR